MRLSWFGVPLLVLCLSPGVASAINFSFTGTFLTDDQIEAFLFMAPTPNATVTLRTYGYAGGTNAAGMTIPAGGLDPILSVFAVNGGVIGTLIGSNNDGAGVPVDPATGNAFDSLLALSTLTAGQTYAVILSQNDNAANGPTFADGFLEAGNGNFTAAFGCGGPAFCDVTPSQRTGFWAVDILGAGAATDISMPEPGSFLLLGAGIVAMAFHRRRSRQA